MHCVVTSSFVASLIRSFLPSSLASFLPAFPSSSIPLFVSTSPACFPPITSLPFPSLSLPSFLTSFLSFLSFPSISFTFLAFPLFPPSLPSCLHSFLISNSSLSFLPSIIHSIIHSSVDSFTHSFILVYDAGPPPLYDTPHNITLLAILCSHTGPTSDKRCWTAGLLGPRYCNAVSLANNMMILVHLEGFMTQ